MWVKTNTNFKRPAPFYTQQMRSQWVVKLVTLTATDFSCEEKNPSQREGWQARDNDKRCFPTIPMWPSELPKVPYFWSYTIENVSLHQAKSGASHGISDPGQFSKSTGRKLSGHDWKGHSSGCDCNHRITVTQIPAQETSAYILQSMIHIAMNHHHARPESCVSSSPCMVEREAGTPREHDVEPRVTHASKGLEFCNPLNTCAFRNLF